MPATYAHLRFGRTVLAQLGDTPTAALIKKHRDLFEIGLQGPDILFFYHPLSSHPINRLGHWLHTQTAASFLTRAEALGGGEAEFVYLLGFICHFVLDSECHSHVQYYMKKTGRGHSEIETEWERFLMYRDGRDPMRHRPSGYLADTLGNARVIAPFYGGVHPLQLRNALTSMKMVGRLLCPENSLKRNLLLKGIGLLGEDPVARQLVIDPSAPEELRESNLALLQKMVQAQPVAITLMENYLAYRQGRCPLSPRFSRTFEADPEELVRIKEEHGNV